METTTQAFCTTRSGSNRRLSSTLPAFPGTEMGVWCCQVQRISFHDHNVPRFRCIVKFCETGRVGACHVCRL